MRVENRMTLKWSRSLVWIRVCSDWSDSQQLCVKMFSVLFDPLI